MPKIKATAPAGSAVQSRFTESVQQAADALALGIDPDADSRRALDDLVCEIGCCLERLSSAEWALCAAQQLTGDGYEHAAVLARTEILIAWDTLDAIRGRMQAGRA